MQAIVNDVTRTITNTMQNLQNLQRLHPARLRALVLAVLIVCLGAAPISLGALQAAEAPTAQANVQAGGQGAGPATNGPAGNGPATTDKAKAKAAVDAVDKSKAASRAQPRQVAPVAGLDQIQMNHAKTIVDVANKMKLPKQAAVVAVSTAMQETKLRNLANTGLPESLNLPNDGTGFDHDSVGLFQQRPASGWGPVNQLMDPATSARKFYQALDQVPGWQDMPVTVAAQTVQGSAFPDAYAQHEPAAQAVVDALIP
jgi:hypothetical protein